MISYFKHEAPPRSRESFSRAYSSSSIFYLFLALVDTSFMGSALRFLPIVLTSKLVSKVDSLISWSKKGETDGSERSLEALSMVKAKAIG